MSYSNASGNMFGIYTKKEHGEKRCMDALAGASEWREAAIADGWSAEPTYSSEPLERAARLTRNGFVARVLTRNNMDRSDRLPSVEAHVSLWGPDGLAINVPPDHDFSKIEAGTRTCSNCKKTDVDTVRYSFAGRCCNDCLPAMRAQHEKPGWCD